MEKRHVIYESRKDYEKRMQKREKEIHRKEGLIICVVLLIVGLIIFLGAIAGIIRGHFNEAWIMLIGGAILTLLGFVGVRNKFRK
jgi:fatty acid desaturase